MIMCRTMNGSARTPPSSLSSSRNFPVFLIQCCSILLILILLSVENSSNAFVFPPAPRPTNSHATPASKTKSSATPSSSSSSLSSLAASIVLTSTPLFSSTSIKRRVVPPSTNISLLEPIANGTFGQVHWAKNEDNGQTLVAKSARAATPDQRAQRNAKSYLEIESYINSKLYPPDSTDMTELDGRQHIAPYLGEYIINGTTHLLWEEAGDYTLEDYIEMEDGWVQLAMDLGITTTYKPPVLEGGDENKNNNFDGNDTGMDGDDERDNRQQLRQQLAAEVLRQMLEGLAYCHSCGIVHRDIKPANILVDSKTHTLRIIDFGSACCMSSWSANKIGYRGKNKGPRSILYCAPEEFIKEEYPYAFDMYGVAITWLQTVLSEDGPGMKEEGNYDKTIVALDANGTQSTFGLGDEEQLWQWRVAMRDFGHNLVAWEEYAVLHSTLPYGWDSLFGSSRQGMQALRLLSNMLSYSPERRMSASEALLGPYLNPGCDASPPDLPPAMPWSIMSHVQRWKKDKEVHSWQDGECRIDDLFTEVVAVELALPLELTLKSSVSEKGAAQKGGGVVVTRVIPGTDVSKVLRSGDKLVAIGSIDVESATLDHVNELLEQWPNNKPVPMLVLRDSE